MAGQPVRIGPFVGGMNTYSGPSSIADNEAVDILNMDVDLDGALLSRPGLEVLTVPGAVTDTRGHIIGTYRSTAGVVYMIFNYDNNVYAYNTSAATWHAIVADMATACVQYNDKLYIVLKPSGTTQGGGKWDPVGGYVAIAAMPRGYSAVIYKERMFISASRNGDETSINRVKFSNPGNPDAWTSTDTFDVSAGDGEDITAIVVHQAAIVVFKTDSTFLFAYESSPTKGQVQKISNTIGANNQFSVVEYENNLFVAHENNIYRISNWNWEHANIKVPFVFSNVSVMPETFNTSLSLLNNRLICRYYENYYVLGLKTGAWVRWQFDGRTPSEFVTNPNMMLTTGAFTYYAGSYKHNPTKPVSRFSDTFADVLESFPIRLVTKSYDFGPSYGFKRLFWWGVDILSKTPTTYKVSPLVYNTPVTWGQIGAVPISQLQTWGRPLDVSLDVTDSANTSNPSDYRTFIKLLKSLRFRQAFFTLESTVDGTTNTGPYRIFSLTAFVDSKQLVSKQVS